MRIFTIENGKVSDGAKVNACCVFDKEKTFPAIVVGEHTARTHLGILPIYLNDDQYRSLLANGETVIHYGSLKTIDRNVRLFAQDSPDSERNEVLCVFLTDTPHNGRNLHGGDFRGEAHQFGRNRNQPLAKFPGVTIARGTVFRGEQTHNRYGSQLVATIPVGEIFTVCSFEWNGESQYHSFLWTGNEMLGGITPDERNANPEILRITQKDGKP